LIISGELPHIVDLDFQRQRVNALLYARAMSRYPITKSPRSRGRTRSGWPIAGALLA
jgi:hypothetical protein